MLLAITDLSKAKTGQKQQKEKVSVPFAGPKIDPEAGHKIKSDFIIEQEANTNPC